MDAMFYILLKSHYSRKPYSIFLFTLVAQVQCIFPTAPGLHRLFFEARQPRLCIFICPSSHGVLHLSNNLNLITFIFSSLTAQTCIFIYYDSLGSLHLSSNLDIITFTFSTMQPTVCIFINTGNLKSYMSCLLFQVQQPKLCISFIVTTSDHTYMHLSTSLDRRIIHSYIHAFVYQLGPHHHILLLQVCICLSFVRHIAYHFNLSSNLDLIIIFTFRNLHLSSI